MKKNITLIVVLLLMVSITLTGCGGGTEEPAATPDPAVEVAATPDPAVEADATTISKEELIAKYNECSALFNEVEDALVKNGTYDVKADVKADMDYIYELLGKAEVVIQSDDLSDEEAVSVYDELQTHIDQMNEFKDAYM